MCRLRNTPRPNDLFILRLKLMPVVPAFAHVTPCGIDADDKRDLLDPKQSLDLLFAANGTMDVFEPF